MKTKELRQKSVEEAKRMLAEARESLRRLRFDIHLKQSKSVRDIRKTRKQIAQLLTILKEK
jgi:large subunit ribosomal protein L29